MVDVAAAVRKHGWTAAFALLIFAGTADRVLAFRVDGVNLRLAYVLLLAGLAAFASTQRARMPELRALAIAWGPFFAIYLFATSRSVNAPLGALKLAWFALAFFGAYACCQLVPRKSLAAGYFAAFAAIAAIIVVDFVNGFAVGPEHMIGLGQKTYFVTPGHRLYRPHAFYYEPSYAATGLGLAFALSLTRLREAVPRLAGFVTLVGAAAIFVTFSRTGWLYALLALVAAIAIGGYRPQVRRRSLIVYGGVVAAIVFALLVPSDNRKGVEAMFRTLGVGQTFERVCPILQGWLPSLTLHCLEGEARNRFLTSNEYGQSPEDTSEGSRLKVLARDVGNIRAHPWLGVGITRGTEHLISPVSADTWVEITVEGGLVSALAFAWGLAYTLRRWQAFRRENFAIGLVLSLYFAVAWQFVQTFPRLDQWLSLWVALSFIAGGTESSLQRASQARSTPMTRVPEPPRA
jgi:hypothetical protein